MDGIWFFMWLCSFVVFAIVALIISVIFNTIFNKLPDYYSFSILFNRAIYIILSFVSDILLEGIIPWFVDLLEEISPKQKHKYASKNKNSPKNLLERKQENLTDAKRTAFWATVILVPIILIAITLLILTAALQWPPAPCYWTFGLILAAAVIAELIMLFVAFDAQGEVDSVCGACRDGMYRIVHSEEIERGKTNRTTSRDSDGCYYEWTYYTDYLDTYECSNCGKSYTKKRRNYGSTQKEYFIRF